jgi:poly-gamma-glutamate synthesis protein (capsule biosynthesis protein)
MGDRIIYRPSFLFSILVTVLLLLAGCRRTDRTVKLALLGDINLGRGVHPAAESLNFLAPDLQSADLVLANLESPLATSPPLPAADGYDLCASAERAAFLSDWSIDLVSLANNHRLDCSTDGIALTTAALKRSGITPIGSGLEAVSRTLKGMKLAFLAFDDVSAPVDVDAAVAAIRSSRQAGTVVIVSVHWGMEYQAGPTERQQTLARAFAEAGATLIWGHHPHVIQRSEWIETAAGHTLVLYSLGNALFDQEGLANTRESALVLVELDPAGILSLRAVPFIIDIASSRVLAAPPADAEKILARLKIE